MDATIKVSIDVGYDLDSLIERLTEVKEASNGSTVTIEYDGYSIDAEWETTL